MARINFRQGIVKHGKTPQQSFFLQQNGSDVNLLISPEFTTIAFADGEKDYLFTESVSITSAWTGFTIPSQDYWLFWDLDRITGIRTFGSTTFEPIYASTEPVSPATGQMWFDIGTINSTSNRMHYWNGGAWIHVLRVISTKLNNSQFFSPIDGSSIETNYIGTQIGATGNVMTNVGSLVFDKNGKPIINQDGRFFTTEDVFTTGVPDGSSLKINNELVPAQASQPLGAFQVVVFDDFETVSLASTFFAIDKIYGLVNSAAITSEIVNVITKGSIFNPAWDFSTTGATPPMEGNINDPVYVTSVGELTTDIGFAVPGQIPVGAIIGKQTILFSPGIYGTINVPPTSSHSNLSELEVDDHLQYHTDARGDVRYYQQIVADSVFAPIVHTHTKADITDFAHAHVESDITDLDKYTKSEVDAFVNNLDGTKVNISGSSMTGPLVLPADPTSALQAATKQYVDALASVTNPMTSNLDVSGFSLNNSAGTFTLPVDNGTNGFILQTDGGGITSWVAAAVGGLANPLTEDLDTAGFNLITSPAYGEYKDIGILVGDSEGTDGGSLTLKAGSNGYSNGDGGNVTITAGSQNYDGRGYGGSVTISSGYTAYSGSYARGSQVSLTSGDGYRGGYIRLTHGVGSGGSGGYGSGGYYSGAVKINSTGSEPGRMFLGRIFLEDNISGYSVRIAAPDLTAYGYYTSFVYPPNNGTNEQALLTDGNGVTSWGTVASGNNWIHANNGSDFLRLSAPQSVTNSFAAGFYARANGDGSIAISGYANGSSSIAIGQTSSTAGSFQIALGYGATTTQFEAAGTIAIGSYASAVSGVAIGLYANSDSEYGVAIGAYNAIGSHANFSTVIGSRSSANNPNQVVLGTNLSAAYTGILDANNNVKIGNAVGAGYTSFIYLHDEGQLEVRGAAAQFILPNYITGSIPATTAVEGGAVWDSTTKELKIYDGIAFTAIGGGGGSTTLDGLTDVTITTPSTNQVLTYNGANWINQAPAATGSAKPGYEKINITGSPVSDVVNTTVATVATSGSPLEASLQVFRNGLMQEEDLDGASPILGDFIVSGANQLTFAPGKILNGDVIIIYVFN